MYASPDALFNLVKTLTPEEYKDFQKKLRQSAKGQSNYLRLLDTVFKAEQYDEKILKANLAKHIPNASFTVVKNQLNERLLDYLNKSKPTAVKKMHAWLDYIELLVSRELFHEANTYIEKIKKEAKRHSLLYLVLEANRWKRFILQYIYHDNYEKVSKELATEIFETANAMLTGYKVGSFYAHVLSLFPQNLNLRNREFIQTLEGLKKHECFSLDGTSGHWPFLTVCYLAMAKNFIYKFTGEFELAYRQEKTVWDLLEKDWNWFYEHKREEVLGSAVNYLEALSSTTHHEEFRKHMDYVEHLISLEKNASTYLRGAVMFYRLMDKFNTNGEDITDGDIQPFIQYYREGKTDKYIELKRLYEAYICRGLFIRGRYSEAIAYCDHIIQGYGRNDVRQDYYENALFMRLLFLFTLHISESYKKMDMDAVMYDAKRYIEHIRHKDPNINDYRLEYAFMDFFKVIKNKPNPDVAMAKLEHLQGKLTGLFAEGMPHLLLARLHFDYILVVKRWQKYLGS